ncbi:MAG: hypothetical protein H6Q20_732 [Bacteroidetes bacterium]|nr:hypothetical protein [Bacteroidota bacterium]
MCLKILQLLLNYLAHIFLSGNHPQIRVGNFIGDFVKGNRYELYPPKIREGILLHRRIDSFTDAHPVVRETTVFLRPQFGRYAAIVTDMYFDYFLAKNFRDYSNTSLTFFAYGFYCAALINYKYLPARVRGFIFHFITTNRLGKYATADGLYDSLRIMSVYKIPALNPKQIIDFLAENHDELEAKFRLFFPDLQRMVNDSR